MQTPLVLQISDCEVLAEATLVGRIVAAGQRAAPGRFGVQLRDPTLDTRSLLRFGRRLREATESAGVSLIVNDRVDLARAIDADGVHLGRRSIRPSDARALLGDDVWLSVSAHGVEELASLRRQPVQAIVLSPVFASPGKGRPLGLAALRRAREQLPPDRGVSLLALGGVSLERAAQCLAAGADGVAAIRADLVGLLDRGRAC